MPYPRQLDFDTRLALWIGEMLHRFRVWLEPLENVDEHVSIDEEFKRGREPPKLKRPA